MALACFSPELVNDSDLEKWERIDSGGFGNVYKARHRAWCCDVAVKLLRNDDVNGTALLREVRMMQQGSSPYVVLVRGVFQGQLPRAASTTCLGLVMEFMEIGSLYSVQKALKKPLPLPLVFRLAHQVALGITFLHSRKMLHLDLKPGNVLLDNYLNAKLTDFGLAKMHHSRSQASDRDSDSPAGTLNYMPPEAVESASYTPTQATDIYSYGILLWSIATGKPPYDSAISSLVRFHIKKGIQSLLDEIDKYTELRELKELMERCCAKSPSQRPTAKECTTETEKMYDKYKSEIDDAVLPVLKELKEKKATEHGHKVHFTQASTRSESGDRPDNVPTGPRPVQEVGSRGPERQPISKGSHPSQPDSQSRSKHIKPIKPSSVQPIHSQPPSDMSRKFPRDSQEKKPMKAELSGHYQRQHSSPNYNQPRVTMHLCNVTGFQQGNNNIMHIVAANPAGRRRHRTEPSRINRPPPQ
ncbi:unnamed protein product [Ophioblennius macclurei]